MKYNMLHQTGLLATRQQFERRLHEMMQHLCSGAEDR